MPEEFEDQDLRDAVFWGVDLRGATFRDVDLSGARITHSRLVDLEVDALVDRLVVNGVDVTDAVNAGDRWHPLRVQIVAEDPAGMRAAWAALEAAWAPVIERAQGLTEAQRRASVAGEWSLVQTLRHLVFAMDKWFTVPVLGGSFHPWGLPNTGSTDFGFPGLALDSDPSFGEALAVRVERAATLRDRLGSITPADLAPVVDVLENGPNAVGHCIRVVFEEEFQHLRYALRDLDRLA